jgi:hypothetical protein
VAPAEAAGGDLIEGALLATIGLTDVLAAVALAQAVEHLVLAGRGRQLGVAGRHFSLTLFDFAHAQLALGLRALQERLATKQVGGAECFRAADGAALLLTRVLQMSVSGAQLSHGAGVARDRIRELLLSELLLTLAHNTHAL